MSEYKAYMGLDVSKDTIAVALARPGRTDPEGCGTIPTEATGVGRGSHPLGECTLSRRTLKMGQGGTGYPPQHDQRAGEVNP